MADTLTSRKRIGWTPIIVVVTLLIVVALALNAWNDRQQQSNIDGGTEQFIEVCESTGDC